MNGEGKEPMTQMVIAFCVFCDMFIFLLLKSFNYTSTFHKIFSTKILPSFHSSADTRRNWPKKISIEIKTHYECCSIFFYSFARLDVIGWIETSLRFGCFEFSKINKTYLIGKLSISFWMKILVEMCSFTYISRWFIYMFPLMQFPKL